MNIVLGHDEELIKEWKYSLSSNSTLIVTDKRIVSTTGAGEHFRYAEIPINSVKSIYCQRIKKSNSHPIAMIILGALLMLSVVVAFLAASDRMMKIIFGVLSLPAIGGGIALIVWGVRHLNRGMFSLVITTVGKEGSPLILATTDKMSLSSSNGGSLQSRLNTFVSSGKTDRKVIDEMCSEIGSIIMNNKA